MADAAMSATTTTLPAGTTCASRNRSSRRKASERRRRNRLAHALNGNGPTRGPINQSRTRTPPRGTPAARVSPLNKPSTREEIEAAAYTFTKAPPELTFLHRNRLTNKCQEILRTQVRASHFVGGDWLDPTSQLLMDTELLKADATWGGEGKRHPLMVLPSHVERLKDKLYDELMVTRNIEAFTIACSLERELAEKIVDVAAAERLWRQHKSFETLMGLGERSWGVGVHVKHVRFFMEPFAGLRVPQACTQIPPPSWEEAQLPLQRVLVTITLAAGQGSYDVQHVGRMEPFATMKDNQRGDLVPVVFELALLQLKSGKGDAYSKTRKAVEQAVQLATGQKHPLFVGRVSTDQDRCTTIVDLPAAMAAKVVANSGAVRGVFARPMLGGKMPKRKPPGFDENSHRVVWAKVEKFSDTVFETLKARNVVFDGLVCGRQKSEVGVRVPVGKDVSSLPRIIAETLGGSAKVKPAEARPAVRLRMRAVPSSLVFSVETVLDRIAPQLTVKSKRILGSYQFTADLELLVEGTLPDDKTKWVFNDLGAYPVRVERLALRQPGKPTVPQILKRGDTLVSRRTLKQEERRNWADVVRLPENVMEVEAEVEESPSSVAPTRREIPQRPLAPESLGAAPSPVASRSTVPRRPLSNDQPTQRQEQQSRQPPKPQPQTQQRQQRQQSHVQRHDEQPNPTAAAGRFEDGMREELRQLRLVIESMQRHMSMLERRNAELEQALQTHAERARAVDADDPPKRKKTSKPADEVDVTVGGGEMVE